MTAAGVVARLWRGLLLVLALAGLVAATLWWWNTTGLVPVAQSLYPVVPAATLLVALLAAVSRARRALAVAGVALLVAVVAAGPTLVPGGAAAAGAGATSGSGGAAPMRLNVLALNTMFGSADVDALARERADRGVDVLVVSEAGPEFARRVRESPIGVALPHDSGDGPPGDGGTVVFSRYPLRVLDPGIVADRHQQPLVELEVGGRRVLVQGVHTMAPVPLSDGATWQAQLAHLGQTQRAADEPLIMAGDFNAAWPHPAFRAAAAGLDDALRDAGRAWSPTWPAIGRYPAFTQIDHVLTKGFAVQAADTVRVAGTDHVGVWAQLALG